VKADDSALGERPLHMMPVKIGVWFSRATFDGAEGRRVISDVPSIG
jgi:hypothetical protein